MSGQKQQIMEAYLFIRADPRWVEVLELTAGNPVTIGPARENVIVTDDPRSNPEHAEILPSDAGWTFRRSGFDPSGRDGELPVPGDQLLQPGDEILVGRTRIAFAHDPSDPFQGTSGMVSTGGTKLTDGDVDRLALELSQAADRKTLAETALERLAEMIGVEHGAVLLASPGSLLDDTKSLMRETPLEIVAVRGSGQEGYSRLSVSLANRVMTERQSVLVRGLGEELRRAGLESPGQPSVNSLLCVPLSLGPHCFGLLHIYSKGQQRTLDTGDLQAAMEAAQVIALALERLDQRESARAARRLIEARLEGERHHLEASKLDAVGRLAGGVAHHFNNLLQTILGYTALAIDGLTVDEPRYQDLEQVRAAGEKAAELAKHLSVFARIQLLHASDLNLNDMLAEMRPLLQMAVGESIVVDLILGVEPGIIHADRGMLEQALLQVSANARDAMPQGGTLTIRTWTVQVGAASGKEHPGIPPGNYVVLSLMDTGQGIPQESLAHLFEPFFTTKPQSHGTGLGLAMVYGVVKQHSGSVHVFSHPGQGTTFALYLPRIDRQSQPARRIIASAAPGGTETILLAEDDRQIREFAARVLKSAGYEVLAAEDGDEAVRRFAEHRPSIALVLLDVLMPKLNGPDAAVQIRALAPDVRLLFTTGLSPDFPSPTPTLYSVEPLFKPYLPDALLRKVREALDRRQER